jgi:crotonobetainyl-CoA:carnitine CoA-transferase CaiB-like acyl-CoA transferase
LPPPLAGLRVVDLSRVLAGPYCTMLLADLGADVVKVELPGVGDETRRWGPPFAADGESAYYLSVNRNKRSLTVNLRESAGRDVLHRLLARADVLIENFRPGALDEMGLGYAALHDRYPRLIYGTISAFGSRGPRREQPGYDFAIQALGGIMSITGEPDGEPSKVGVAVVDITAGLHALVAILAALRAGRGQHVEVSLFQSQLAWLVNVASGYLVSGREPRRWGNAHPQIVPYQTFRGADGWVAIACGNDAQFRALCGVLGLEADARFATNPLRVEHREELVARLSALMAGRAVGELLAALEATRVPCAPVNTVAQALADPQAEALGVVLGSGVRWPFELSDTPAELRREPPGLGEHTDEVLAELGYDPEAIARLREGGAV